jgi:outer membrane protein OmpA-like peptidoglycan-associated protein
MRRTSVLAGFALLTLAGGGCIATRPYVRTQVQSSEARTEGRVDSVERRVDIVERDLAEERTRRLALEADLVQVRRMTEETARQADQTREVATQGYELAAQADSAARDALRTAASLPAPPPPPPVVASPETFVVHFAVADSRLDNSSRMTLTKALKRLQQNPALVVKVQGYTDNTGSASVNVKLSQRRAEEVWRFLVGNGVKRNRIETHAMGEARPVAPNDSPNGRDQNRRVSVTLVSAAGP